LALGWLAALPVAAYLAAARLRELEAVAAWIERLPDEQEAGPDPAAAAEGLCPTGWRGPSSSWRGASGARAGAWRRSSRCWPR
jgi:hypothetical protein